MKEKTPADAGMKSCPRKGSRGECSASLTGEQHSSSLSRATPLSPPSPHPTARHPGAGPGVQTAHRALRRRPSTDGHCSPNAPYSDYSARRKGVPTQKQRGNRQLVHVFAFDREDSARSEPHEEERAAEGPHLHQGELLLAGVVVARGALVLLRAVRAVLVGVLVGGVHKLPGILRQPKEQSCSILHAKCLASGLTHTMAAKARRPAFEPLLHSEKSHVRTHTPSISTDGQKILVP